MSHQPGPSANQTQQPTPDLAQQGGFVAPGSARHAEEQARKDRTLTEFMLLLDEYEPMVRTSRLRCLFQGHIAIPTFTDTERSHRLLSAACWVRV